MDTRYLIDAITESTIRSFMPSNKAEYDRHRRDLTREHYTVVSEVDTTDNDALFPIVCCIMTKRTRFAKENDYL